MSSGTQEMFLLASHVNHAVEHITGEPFGADAHE